MTESTSERLKKCSRQIMDLWFARAMSEIQAAPSQEALALRNSLPGFLDHLADAISQTIDRTEARRLADRAKSSTLGKKHGRERASSIHYTLDQLIFEYHILRQVIFDVLEREIEIKPAEREIIVCAIEQAVNDAATEFTDTLRDLQTRLTYSLAHDLRSPIAAAKASAQLILRRPDSVDNCLNKATRIRNDMDRLDKMIRDLLDATRLRAGEEIPLEFDECDLDFVARQVADDFNHSQKGKVLVRSPGVVVGIWNENGLRRVIENLISNAIKYGSEEAPVTISLTVGGENVFLSVHNEGPPIPPEEQELLFQQFKRAKKSEKSKQGWGIGLTVIQGLVRAHKGTIQVESQEGKGTSFIVSLPRNSQDQSPIHHL